MSINRVVISGNLTRDSELRSMASGVYVLGMGVAVNDRRRNQQTGEWEDYPNYIDCTMFGARADSLHKYLVKGTKVAIEGRLRWTQWERDGLKRSKVDVVVEDLEFLSGRTAQANPSTAMQQQEAQEQNAQQQGIQQQEHCGYGATDRTAACQNTSRQSGAAISSVDGQRYPGQGQDLMQNGASDSPERPGDSELLEHAAAPLIPQSSPEDSPQNNEPSSRGAAALGSLPPGIADLYDEDVPF